MNGLENIAVSVVHDATTPDKKLNEASALLHEITSLLQQLINNGACGRIDLRRSPLDNDDLTFIKQTLGQGEVCITVNTLGSTQIQETAIAGVWWVTHLNEHNKVQCETIEIAAYPEIINAHPDDIQADLSTLRSRLDQQFPTSTLDPASHERGE